MDWMEGRLTAGEAARVAQQVAAAGETTRAAVAWLQAFYRLSHEVTLAAPPDEVRRYLAGQFEAIVQRQSAGLFQRLVATLTFDSHAQPLATGLRSAATPGRERQLVYTTTVADVVLNLGTAGDQLNIAGQIFPLDENDTEDVYSVQLLRGATEEAITAADDLGEFTFQSVLPGVYDIVLSSARAEVVIPSVELTSQV